MPQLGGFIGGPLSTLPPTSLPLPSHETTVLPQALDLDQPILIGWSMGGMNTLTSAALFSDSYSRFVAFPGSAGSLEVPTPDPTTVLRIIDPDSNDRLPSIDNLFPPDKPSGELLPKGGGSL